jgi:protoheme IX farnesyltransferase
MISINRQTLVGLTSTSLSAIKNYFSLTKPVVVSLLLMTTYGGMILAADGWPGARITLFTLLGGAFSAGGASAINQYIDRDRDGSMQRTRKRPIPSGKVSPRHGLLFGIVLCLFGIGVFGFWVNPESAALAFIGMVYYLLFYSLILKSTTPQNIVIGGGAGAIPVLVGWAAVTGTLSMPAWFLFAVVFFWTPPHFWALALVKRKDYERAGVPMFPVVYGERETKRQIILYSIQLAAMTILLPLVDLGGYFFLISAIALGLILILFAWRLWKKGGNRAAWGMYRYSSMYLAFIFAALILDTLLI